MNEVKCPYCGKVTNEAICPRCRAAVPHKHAEAAEPEPEAVTDIGYQPRKHRKTDEVE